MKTYYHNLVRTSLAKCQMHLPTRSNRHLSLLGILTAAFGVSVLLLAGYLKHQGADAGIFTNFVSSLGWGANGSHEVFKFGLTVLTGMLIAFVLLLVVALREHAAPSYSDDIHELTHHGAGAWYIAAAGLCILAWFVDIRVPEPSEALIILLLHIIGAAMFFSFSVLGALKLTRAMTLHGMASRAQHWLVKSTVFNTVIMGISIIPLIVASYNAGLLDAVFVSGTEFFNAPEQRVVWIKSITSNYPWISFFEWGAVLSMLGWAGVTAIQVYRVPMHANAVKQTFSDIRQVI